MSDQRSSSGTDDEGLASVEEVFARVEKMILLADGDRDYGNQSALKCNDTMVALHLLRHLMNERSSGVAQAPIAQQSYRIEHDGFEGVQIGSYVTLEGKEGLVLQQHGTRVVHVYGRKWATPLPSTDRSPE